MHSGSPYFAKISLLAGVLSLISGVCIEAQDFEKIAPKIPQRNEDTVTLPTDLKEIKGSEKVLVDKLEGIMFVQNMQDVTKQGLTNIHGVATTKYGLELLQQPSF